MAIHNLAHRRRLAAEESSEEFSPRRAEIIAAAATTFAERGYEETTLADIGRRAGIKRVNIYYYFASKEEILQDVLFEVISANLERVRAIRQSSDSATMKIRAAIVDMMVSYEENYPHQYVYVRADTKRLWETGDDRTRQILNVMRAYRLEFEAIIDEGMATGEFRDIASSEILTYAIVGMVNWTQRWFEPGSGMSGHELGEIFANLAVTGLTGGMASSIFGEAIGSVE